MKIGIVSEYYYPTIGGIQEHVHHFAACARRAGHDVRILTPTVHDRLASPKHATKDEHEGVIRIGRSVPVPSAGSIARVSVGVGLTRRLREVLASERFDVLHLHSPLMPTLPLLSLPLADCATVGTFHSVVDKSLLMALLRGPLQRRLDRLDVAIGVSEVALRGLEQRFRARYCVVPNGVDVKKFADGRRRPELDDGRPNVVHVGRFDPRNGVDRVIRTFCEVRRRGVDARLVLVGDGPLRRHYERMVPAALAADVRFEGFVPDGERASYYASADVLLCPAVGGTFGIILVEAMAAGCPIVCADTPGSRTVMRDGAQGAMIDLGAEGAIPQLADAVTALLGDERARRRAGAAGRRAAAQYDWPKVTRRVLAIYEQLLGRRDPIADDAAPRLEAAGSAA